MVALVEIEVVDERDRPVPRAQVVLGAEPGDPDGFLLRLKADESGRVSVRDLAPGRYAVAAATPSGTDFRRGMQSLELHGEDTRRVRVRFEEGTRVSGIVVDKAGLPLSDVEVSVFPFSRLHLEPYTTPMCELEEPVPEHFILGTLEVEVDHTRELTRSVRTGPDGRFSVSHLLPRPHGIACRKFGYKQVTTTSVFMEGFEVADPYQSLGYLLVPMGASDCRLVLSYQGLVSGRVVRANGEPVTSFLLDDVHHTSPDGTFKSVSRGWVEEPGPWGDEPMLQCLRISAPGLVGIRKEFKVAAGSDVDLGELVLEQGRPVRVRVVEAGSSLPVADAELVKLQDVTADRTLSALELGSETPSLGTNEEGTCLIPAVPPCPLKLNVWRKGYEHAAVVLGPEEREVTVVLQREVIVPPRGAIVRGQVRAGGVPIPSGRVSLRSRFLRVVDGAFSGFVHPPGPCVVRVSCDGPPESRPVFVPRRVEVPEEGTLVLDFDDAHGATLEVEVPDSGWLRGLVLVAGTPPPPRESQGFSALKELGHPEEGWGASGVHRFRSVPAGRYTLVGMYWEPTNKDRMFLRQEVELPAEGTVRLSLSRPW